MSLARRLLMSELRAPKRIRDELEAKIKASECIVCGKEAKTDVVRGLCPRCYHQFLREMKLQGSKEKQLKFETECIKAGYVLPVGEQSRMKSTSPFKDVG